MWGKAAIARERASAFFGVTSEGRAAPLASCFSMKLAKARALALTCRPAGKTVQRSIGGNDQSSSTDFTAPDLSSGANIQSEAIARPSPARQRSRERGGRQ